MSHSRNILKNVHSAQSIDLAETSHLSLDALGICSFSNFHGHDRRIEIYFDQFVCLFPLTLTRLFQIPLKIAMFECIPSAGELEFNQRSLVAFFSSIIRSDSQIPPLSFAVKPWGNASSRSRSGGI